MTDPQTETVTEEAAEVATDGENALAAADTSAEAAPAADGAPAAAQEGSEPPVSAAAARPEFLPEKFWNAEKGEPNLEGLAKSYGELEQARLLRAKNAPDDYKLPVSFKGFENQIRPETLTTFKELAQAEGYSQRGFELLVESVYGKPAEGRKALEAEYGDKLSATLAACEAFASTLGEHQEAVNVLTSFPAGVKLLDAWRLKSGDAPLPGQPGEAAASKTEPELKEMMRDKRYGTDPAYTEEVTQGWQALYSGQTVKTAPLNRHEVA